MTLWQGGVPGFGALSATFPPPSRVNFLPINRPFAESVFFQGQCFRHDPLSHGGLDGSLVALSNRLPTCYR